MLRGIKDIIEKFSMLKKGDRIIVAVSGGPDSVCLFSVLDSLKKELGINLFCAHLNHQLRGAESDGDERYIRRLADKLRIPILIESKDTAKFAKEKKFSLEQAARELRYDFLLRAAKKMDANKIAMGHTRDDQAETLLIRLLRGAGLRGLKAIPPMRKLSPNIYIIRPLIETPREEIMSFLKKRKIKARLDSTNVKAIFLRNRLRHKLIPVIEKYYSPKIKEILARTANALDADYDYLIKQQRRAFKRIAKIKNGVGVNLSIKRLRSLETSLKRGIVRLAIENVKGDLKSIDYRHWERIENLISERNINSTVHLPGGISVIRKPRTLLFAKEQSKRNINKLLPTVIIKVPGKTRIAKRLKIKSSILNAPPKAFSVCPDIEYFDFDKIKFPLKVRYRRPFDKMRPLGMKRYKRLQDIFIDDKVKVNKRAKIPIIVDAKGKIIWVCGVRMSENYKVTPRIKRCLRLSLVRC